VTGDYRALILTSDEGAVSELAEVGEASFASSRVLYWQMGNLATKPSVIEEIEATDYNLLVSHVNGVILKPHHLARATFGAINVHPAPPEHGGAFGNFCQPVVDRGFRTHHGVLVHELDEEVDRGPIYRVRRWEVGPEESIQSVRDRSFVECLSILREVLAELAAGSDGTRCFAPTGESWHPTNRHHTVEDLRRWFAALDPAHPAHRERVPFNHPRAIYSPPYFDDL